MILNNAKDILIGNTPIKSAYMGAIKVWDRSSFEFMPIMTGVTDYFDCTKGMTTETWQNLAGGNNAFWVGMEIQPDGSAGVTGRSWSYGQFTSPYTTNRTIYAVFKTDPIGLVYLNGHILASCGGTVGNTPTGSLFSISVEGYQTPDYITSDQMGIGAASTATSENYHVVAVTRDNGHNVIYIDGVAHGTLSNNVAYGNYWGIGVVVYSNGIISNATSWEGLRQIKMIAVGSEAHTAEEIAENSTWLYQKFCV